MLNAEVYRKLPRVVVPSGSGTDEWRPVDQEDLLTSDAMGALAILPRSISLFRLFERIRRISDDASLDDVVLAMLKERLDQMEVRFWPSYEVPSGFASLVDHKTGGAAEIRSVEPDVVMRPMGMESGKADSGIMVVLEAKWRGSNLGDDVSQLAREYWVLRKEAMDASSRAVQPILLCVTAGRSAPLVWKPELSSDGKSIVKGCDRVEAPEQIEQYLRLVGRHLRLDLRERCESWAEEVRGLTYWVSWLEIAAVITESREKLIRLHAETSNQDPIFQELAASALRLAGEACRVVVDLRNLRGFRGFEEATAEYELCDDPAEGPIFLELTTLNHSGRKP